jgi:hypothetical protein
MNQPRVIRFLLLGLPIGLIITSIIAMVIYFRGDADAAGKTGPHTKREITRKELQAHVEMLSKTIGPRHMGAPDALKFTVNYIEGTLGPANLGYRVARHTYKVGDTPCHNLVLDLMATGSDRIAEIVLVGAHYDTVPTTPGADDNASGVAACMELARAFANTKHERSLRFVFFANEEPPYFQTKDMGSLVYAKECKKRGDEIVAMLSLETMGYYSEKKGSQKAPPGLEAHVPDTGNFLAVIGNATSLPIVETCKDWFARNSTLPVVGMALPTTVVEQGWSDHWSFWQQGYPAVMVTDTALLRNPHYHQAGDKHNTLDYERFTQAVKGLEGVIYMLANPRRAASGK